jgi:spore coat polysaccharide biosynthesis protein SpsF
MANRKRPFAFLQIRTGSTRLPGKMLREFSGGKSIPVIMLHQLKKIIPAEHIVIATTVSPMDDPLAEMAIQQGVQCFRGDENDVLQRFIDAADFVKADFILRICADNPFLQNRYIEDLIVAFENSDYEYISYEFPDGTPIMRSHIGMFAEIMSMDFLRRISGFTREPFYHEHVTNYLYDHRDRFNAHFLPVPAPLCFRRDVRLTVDTEEDFKNLSELYTALCQTDGSLEAENLITEIDRRPRLLEYMQQEIRRNAK